MASNPKEGRGVLEKVIAGFGRGGDAALRAEKTVLRLEREQKKCKLCMGGICLGAPICDLGYLADMARMAEEED